MTMTKSILQRLGILLLTLSALACNDLQECNSDNDCGVGYKCLRSSAGWVESSFCGPYGELPEEDLGQDQGPDQQELTDQTRH